MNKKRKIQETRINLPPPRPAGYSPFLIAGKAEKIQKKRYG